MLIDQIFGWFSKDIAIDLGTSNTRLWVRGQEIVLEEPSMVAVMSSNRTVYETPEGPAIGRIARGMSSRTPTGVEEVRPIRHGVIADFDLAESLLKCFIAKVHHRRLAVYPRVVVAVPSASTRVERRAVESSTERAGARQVIKIPRTLAAGIGAGLPIQSPVASMIVDIGGGTTESAVICMTQTASSESIRIGGEALDHAIARYLRDEKGLLVSEVAAEEIKIAIGSAWDLTELEGQGRELAVSVMGTDAQKGMPAKVDVGSVEIREVLREPIAAIVAAIRRTIEKTKPQLAADLFDRGLTLCGGGSLLRGLDRRIQEDLGVQVRIAADPERCVVRGTGIYLENRERFNGYAEAA